MTKEKDIQETSRLDPVFKWAGGKRQLLGKLIPLMPEEYGTYYEPFIGGAALLLAVQPEKAVINDVNSQLLNVYHQMSSNSENLISRLKEMNSAPCDKERYYAERDRFNEKIAGNITDLEAAALFLYVNKTAWNGLFRMSSGKGFDKITHPDGTVEKVPKTPRFNVPWNKKEYASIDYDNLTRVGEYFTNNDVTILEGDFADAVATAAEGDFVYFDSPYVPETETANFTAYTKDGFNLEDHKRLAELCRDLDSKGVKFMLSNNDVPLVHELYKGFDILSVEARRAINRDGNKRKGQEVIIRNYG